MAAASGFRPGLPGLHPLPEHAPGKGQDHASRIGGDIFSRKHQDQEGQSVKGGPMPGPSLSPVYPVQKPVVYEKQSEGHHMGPGASVQQDLPFDKGEKHRHDHQIDQGTDPLSGTIEGQDDAAEKKSRHGA